VSASQVAGYCYNDRWQDYDGHWIYTEWVTIKYPHESRISDSKEEGQGVSKCRRMDGVLEDWRNLGIRR